MDLAAQRMKAILLAKLPNGTWDAANRIELLPSADHSVVMPSEAALAGLV